MNEINLPRSDLLIEPRLAYIYERKVKNRALGPYSPKKDAEVFASLEALFKVKGLKEIALSDVKRMAGGASKEQFSFLLSHSLSPVPCRYVLRMDPLEGIVETCRLREAELLTELCNYLPVPSVLAVDAEGEFLGRPGVITSFISGVTAPTTSSKGVSGVGISYGNFADRLAPQFVRYLVAIHNKNDWDFSCLPSFVVPESNSKAAAEYQINYWMKAWELDKVEPVPIITYTANWLHKHAPVCETPCLVHSDYRIGNFLFEEETAEITSILDWELAHFGDFHEDIAWLMHRFFGSTGESGEFLVCCLLTRQAFIEAYEQYSGRKIDLKILKYYEVMNAWKCALMGLSSALMAAKNSNNHQDVLITWLGSAGSTHLSNMLQAMRDYQKGAF